MTANAPFNGASDVELGVSFVSIFIMVYHIFFWVFGAAASLQWDFLPGVPQGEEAMKRVAWNEKPIGRLVYRWFYQQGKAPELFHRVKGLKQKMHLKNHPAFDEEKYEEGDVYPNILEVDSAGGGGIQSQPMEEGVDPDVQLARRVSRLSAIAPLHISRIQSSQAQPDSSIRSRNSSEPTLPLTTDPESATTTRPSRWERIFPRWLIKIVRPMSTIITPVTIALAISLPVSVIQPLKALFTDATASGGPDWKGPDGNPPLYFVMETGKLALNGLRVKTFVHFSFQRAS